MRKFCWFWLRLHFLSSPRHGLVEIGVILTSVHRPQYCWGKEPDNRLGRGAALVCCSALEWPAGSNLSPSPRAPPTSGGRSPPSAGCTARGPSLHTHLSAIPGTGATLSWWNASLAQNNLLGILKIHHHYFMILKKMQSHLIFQITLHYVYPMFLMHPIYKLPLQVRV